MDLGDNKGLGGGDSEVIGNINSTVLNIGAISDNSVDSVRFCSNQTCVCSISSQLENVHKQVCT